MSRRTNVERIEQAKRIFLLNMRSGITTLKAENKINDKMTVEEVIQVLEESLTKL